MAATCQLPAHRNYPTIRMGNLQSRQRPEMRFGERLRQLRKAKGFTLRDLAARVGVGHTYLSKAENERLEYGDYPSNALIAKLAKVLEADANELLFLAKRIPDRMKKRILERPDDFRKLTELDDKSLDRVLEGIKPGHGKDDVNSGEHRPSSRRKPF
jgi:transcriptional regulator with XRE-family HTH domain